MKTNKQLIANRIKLSKIIYKDKIKLQPIMAGAWVENGKQIMCDGYRTVRYNNILEGLVEAPTGRKINVDWHFGYLKNKRIVKIDIEKLNILYKAAKKINKERYSIVKIENIYLCASLFLEVLNTFDDDVKVYISRWQGDSEAYAIYIKDKDGEGMILPLRSDAKINDEFVLKESMSLEDIK